MGEGEVFIIDGSVAEWSKALVLGTSHFDGVGSNPTAANYLFIFSSAANYLCFLILL